MDFEIQPMLAEVLEFPYSSGHWNGKTWKSEPWPKDYKFTHVGWWMSEKYDGCRAIWTGKKFISRNGNTYNAPSWFRESMPKSIGLDGELFGGNHKFQETSGIIRKKVPNDQEWKKIKFMVFDVVHPQHMNTPYSERYKMAQAIVAESHKRGYEWINVVKQVPIHSGHQMYDFYQKALKEGGEGIMIRNPESKYETKRSSNLLKLKPKHDQEARIIGFNEGKGANKGVLGSFQAEMIDHGAKTGTKTGAKTKTKFFQLSGHINQKFRAQYIFGKDGKIEKHPSKNSEYPSLGSIVTYEYMSLTKDGLPRQPIFLRLRREI